MCIHFKTQIAICISTPYLKVKREIAYTVGNINTRTYFQRQHRETRYFLRDLLKKQLYLRHRKSISLQQSVPSLCYIYQCTLIHSVIKCM